jgi:hypothetical protein
MDPVSLSMLSSVSGMMGSSGLMGGGSKEEPGAPVSVTTGPVSTSAGGSFNVVGGDSLWIVAAGVIAFLWLRR